GRGARPRLPLSTMASEENDAAEAVGAARSNSGKVSPRLPSAPNMVHALVVRDTEVRVKVMFRRAGMAYFFTGKCQLNHCTIASFISGRYSWPVLRYTTLRKLSALPYRLYTTANFFSSTSMPSVGAPPS